MSKKWKQSLSALLALTIAAGCVNLTALAVPGDSQEEPGAETAIIQADSWDAASPFAEKNDRGPDGSAAGGSFAAGDYLAYENLDFGTGGWNTCLLEISALEEQDGKPIELRLDQPDGQLIGTASIEASGDVTLFQDHYVSLEAVTGSHTLYLVFPEATEANIDFFTLSGYDGQETQEEKTERMQWFRDAKFGQFIHFGAYSYLEGEYNGRRPNGGAEWIMKLLGISKEDYARDVAKNFNPTEFDAAEYVSLAKATGQKYLVFTTRHHEGFSMFETEINEFKDYQLSSYGDYQGEDPVKALSEECKKQGIAFCTYYSIPDWHDKAQSNYDTNIDPELKADYVQRMKGQIRELIEKYDPEILWFDGNWMNWWTTADGEDMYRYVRTLKPSIIINNRIGPGNDMGDYGTPEQSVPATGLDYAWESCMTLNGTWGYKYYDNNWKSAETVVQTLVDVASKGGNYLLNIGPDAEGRIPEATTEIFQEVGQWTSVYGDSIYDTQSNIFDELPNNVRATTKEGKVYLHVFDWADTSVLTIPKLVNQINGMKLLGTDTQVEYTEMKDQLLLTLPDVEGNPYDTVIEIDVEGTPEAVPPVYENLALQASQVEGSNVYQNNQQYNAQKAVDGDDTTRWATDNDTSEATLTLTYDQPITINEFQMSFHGSPTNNITKYQIEYMEDGEWKVAYEGSLDKTTSDTTVEGYFDAVTSDQIRLHILEASNPTIWEFELYYKEHYDIQVTSPGSNQVISGVPFVMEGTAVGGTTVEIAINGKDFAPEHFSTTVNPDGSWSCEVNPPSTGKLTAVVSLKDAEGNIVAVTQCTPNVWSKGENLAKNAELSVSTFYGDGYGAAEAVDGNLDTRWSPKDTQTAQEPQWLIADFGEMKTFDTVMISEYFDVWNNPNDYRCTSFSVEYFDGTQWQTFHEGTTIGEEMVIQKEPVTGSMVRLNLLETKANGGKSPANILEFGVYSTQTEEPEEPGDETANKFNLNFYLNKANQVSEDVINALVESAREQFNTAVANAQAVMADENATQEEVDAAAKELRIALNMLSMVAGNKDALNDLISEAEELIANAGNNYPQSAIDELQKAIDAAKEVANDGDAFQADVDKAVEDLQNAMEAFLNSKLDWRALEAAVADGATIAADITDGKYVEDSDAFEAFDTAYAAAQELLNSKTADSQVAIDAATTALLEASAALRYKADKDTLNTVIGEAETVDVTLYTASSVANFKAALAAANTVAADETLSVDDQAVVDDATATLEEAMAALVPIDAAVADGGDNNGSDDTAVAGGGEDTTINGSDTTATKTGDNTPFLALAVLVLAAGAGLVLRKKED